VCDHGDKTKNCDLTQNVIDRLCKFRHGSKLRIAILNILVKTIDAKNYEDLKCQFNLIDSDNTGLITIDELKGVINKKEGMKVPAEEIDNILQEIDYDGNGAINYSEFMAAVLPIDEYVT